MKKKGNDQRADNNGRFDSGDPSRQPRCVNSEVGLIFVGKHYDSKGGRIDERMWLGEAVRSED